jgi:hypothetical protein
MTEKAADTDRRDANRSPRQKVAGVVKGGEETHAEAAVGHGVEEAVADCSKEEIGPQGESAEARDYRPEGEQEGESCQKCRE